MPYRSDPITNQINIIVEFSYADFFKSFVCLFFAQSDWPVPPVTPGKIPSNFHSACSYKNFKICVVAHHLVSMVMFAKWHLFLRRHICCSVC